MSVDKIAVVETICMYVNKMLAVENEGRRNVVWRNVCTRIDLSR
jgi:hypothetical protein